jgi:thymidylate kinase
MKLSLTKSINYSDIEMMAKLYVGANTEIHVFDPIGKVIWDSVDEELSFEFEKRILFNFGGELIRYKEFELSDFDCIVDFSKKIKIDEFKIEKLNIIQAPSGTVRYVYQTNNRKFRFLDFLQTPTLRSKLVKFGLKTLLRLNQVKVVGQRTHVLSQAKLNFQEALHEFSYDNYAISLGIPGFWRKPVIQLQQDNKVSHYIKFAASKQTAALISREQRNNKIVSAFKLKLINLPTLVDQKNSSMLVLRAINKQKLKRISHLNEHLFLSIKELTMKSMKFEKIEGTSFYSEVLDQLCFLKNKSDDNDSKTCYYLTLLKDNIERNQYINTSIAHGDFTPWNIYQRKSSFYVYDWEMTIVGAPALYDVFHFIYQSELLVNRNGLKGVENELIHFFKQPRVADFVERFKIDLDFHHQLYLLHVISKNLMLISQQSTRSADQELLLKSWEKALIELPLKTTQINIRETFLNDIELFLKGKSYAALKFYLPSFQSLPIESGLDLAITKNELIATEKFIIEHDLVKRHVKIKKTSMSTSQIHFGDGSYLSVDFIHDFIRKGVRYMDVKALLYSAKIENGVKRPTLFHDIEYTQHFYTLNNANIPLKYQQIFSQILTKKDQVNTYLDSLKNKYDLLFKDLSDAFIFSPIKKKQIKKNIRIKHSHLGFNLLQKRVGYLQDLLVDLMQNKGFMVTFSGVDGAGKTTIINAVKKQFEQKYRKEVVLMRHRPGVLPILSAIKHGGLKKAEQRASESLPRQGQNKSKLGSYLRFSYYFTDYLFGQIYIYFKYVLRGKIVIYDRYYYDFINDSKRSNIRLKREFIKRLFRFIYKPDFNFYLYNDPEIILKRKQELNVNDLIDLNKKYASLFNEFESTKNGTYHQIKNDIQSDTIAEIFSTINKVA